MAKHGPNMTMKQVELLTYEAAKSDGKLNRNLGLPCFVLRITETGAKSYYLMFMTKAGQSRTATLGRHSLITPEDAYKKARAMLVARDEGRDPVQEARDQVEAQKKMLAEDFDGVSDRYVEERLKGGV